MNSELELTLVNKIHESYSASVHFAAMAKEHAVEAIEKAIECGQYLIEAKTMVGLGNWRSWLAAHVRQLSHDTATRYMKLANISREELQDVYSLRQAYITAGILPKNTNKADPINRDREGTNWIQVFDKYNIKVAELFDARPLSRWEEQEKAIFVERTRPVVNKFVEAGGRL